jgi:hypothetical protein
MSNPSIILLRRQAREVRVSDNFLPHFDVIIICEVIPAADDRSHTRPPIDLIFVTIVLIVLLQ